jgi:hypothetical protein
MHTPPDFAVEFFRTRTITPDKCSVTCADDVFFRTRTTPENGATAAPDEDLPDPPICSFLSTCRVFWGVFYYPVIQCIPCRKSHTHKQIV